MEKLISGWVIAMLLWLNAGLAGASPILISRNDCETGRPIVREGQLFVDYRNEMSWEVVKSSGQEWITPDSDALNFGYSNAAYWVRWTIVNDTIRPIDLVIDLGNPREDNVTWYVIRKDDHVEKYATGDRHPFRQRPLELSRNFALPLLLAPQERVTVYLHLKSHDGFYEPMPVTLYQKNCFFRDSSRHALILTLYHGGLLFLLMYNLLLYFSTKERSFLYYVGYMACLLMWNFTVNGYSFQYLWPNSPVFNNHFLTFCSAYAFGLFGLFTIEYLNLRSHAPRCLVLTIQILSGLNFVVVIPSILDYYAFSVAYGQLVGLAVTVVTLGAGIRLLVGGQRQARFFMSAFTMMGVGATVYICKIIGLAPSNAFTSWALQFGSSFEALILALGLADSMNILKQEKLEAERSAREAQEALAVGLERQVRERTKELAKANKRLQTLAITDELTGAYNRRHFNAICAAVLNQNPREEPLAFCMFDIDHFKRYNDKYGHSAGDDALQRVAQTIQGLLRRSEDTLFRLGGEEFGVLYTANTITKAFDFADKLRKCIYELGIKHHANQEGVITASFGVTYWDVEKNISVEHIYSETDAALYKAKASGRNRVVLKELEF